MKKYAYNIDNKSSLYINELSVWQRKDLISLLTKEKKLIRDNIKVINYTLGKTKDLWIRFYRNTLIISSAETLIRST